MATAIHSHTRHDSQTCSTSPNYIPHCSHACMRACVHVCKRCGTSSRKCVIMDVLKMVARLSQLKLDSAVITRGEKKNDLRNAFACSVVCVTGMASGPL